MVGVQEIDEERFASRRDLAHPSVQLFTGVANGALPQADPAGGNPEIAQLWPEVVWIGARAGAICRDLRHHVPAEQHTDAGAYVAQAHAHVDDVVLELDHRSAAWHAHPMAAKEHDL